MKMITKSCIICGKEFEYRADITVKKYCSEECRAIGSKQKYEERKTKHKLFLQELKVNSKEENRIKNKIKVNPVKSKLKNKELLKIKENAEKFNLWKQQKKNKKK